MSANNNPFGSLLKNNDGCQISGEENLGAVMGNKNVNVKGNRSLLHVHSNENSELDLSHCPSATVLACQGLKLKSEGYFNGLDIRMCEDSEVTAVDSLIDMSNSKHINIVDAVYSSVRAVGCADVKVECKESGIIAHRSKNTSVVGVGLISVIQDTEDSNIDADDSIVIAFGCRRFNFENIGNADSDVDDDVTDDGPANGGGGRYNRFPYVLVSGVDDINIIPTPKENRDINWINFVPSTDDSNERPLRTDVQFVGMAYINYVYYSLGIFRFWKQKQDGEEGSKNNIFQLTFDLTGLDIQSFKVVEADGTKAKFEGTKLGKKQFLEIEGNILGMTDDNKLLISTNVKN